MKLIVGLGNHGKEYENTRHNIGFKVLDDYLNDVHWNNNKYGLYYKQLDVVFVKPNTYMNLSGVAVRYFLKYYKIDITNLLVIHDDMDINLGNFKLKKDGSSGGHNGINSIIENLNSNKFLRLKIGISRALYPDSVNYVLGNFSLNELNKIQEKSQIINNIIDDFISDDTPEILMNKYN